MSDSLITAERLVKSFGAKRVLDDLSFSVDSGDVIGVLGKNGAGKTTLLEIILGFTPPTSGDIRVFERNSWQLDGATKSRLGFVPQQDELIDQLTARNQLRVIGSFYSHWDDALVERLAHAWELNLDAHVKEMSVGQRQKLSILQALGNHPDLLLLDEPVASLDPVARRQFLEQIIEVTADGKRAVVFSSHIVSDVERLANKIWILKDGHFYWRGELDALKESVVRLHIRSTQAFEALTIADALSRHTQDNYLTAVVANWSDERHRALVEHSGGDVEVERLSLEDIFLELHR